MENKEQAFEPVSPNTDKDVKIEPLSGNPYFHVTLCKSHVSSPYQLVIKIVLLNFFTSMVCVIVDIQ